MLLYESSSIIPLDLPSVERKPIDAIVLISSWKYAKNTMTDHLVESLLSEWKKGATTWPAPIFIARHVRFKGYGKDICNFSCGCVA